jgi:hypothetical protein
MRGAEEIKISKLNRYTTKFKDFDLNFDLNFNENKF